MKKRRFATARVFGVLLVLSAACAPFVVEDPVPAQTDTSEPEGDFTLALAPYLPGPAADLMEQAASILSRP